jgi:hypothetical protein
VSSRPRGTTHHGPRRSRQPPSIVPSSCCGCWTAPTRSRAATAVAARCYHAVCSRWIEEGLKRCCVIGQVGKRVSAKRERGEAARVAATAPIPPITDEWLSHLGYQLLFVTSRPANKTPATCQQPPACLWWSRPLLTTSQVAPDAAAQPPPQSLALLSLRRCHTHLPTSCPTKVDW